MSKTSRSIQYRYLNREGIGTRTETLEELLRQGLKVSRDGDVIGEKARARIADLDQSGQLTLLNGVKGIDGDGFVAGELLLYRKGFDVPAITENLESDDNRFELQVFKTDGKNKPVVGALYFAAVKDHVGVIASKAVTARWLERYMTWLLKDKCETLHVDHVIELNASISIDGDSSSRSAPAQGLTISAEGVTNTGEPKTLRRERASGRGGTVLEVLRLLGFGDDAIESIKRDIPEGGNLEGDFQVYIKEGRNRRPVSTSTLDHAFRNLDADDVSLSRKGSKVKGKLLFLSEPVRVTEAPAGLEPNEAIDQIILQLYKWGNNGTINLGSA